MNPLAFLRSRPWWQLVAGAVVLAVGLWLWLRPAQATDENLTITAKRDKRTR